MLLPNSTNRYLSLTDFPQHIKNVILSIKKDNAEVWITKKIPALSNKSILEVMNEDNGDQYVIDYLNRIKGYFGYQ